MTLKTDNRKGISRLILGLDPGSYHTGFAVIEEKHNLSINVLSYGVWNFSKVKKLPFRLGDLAKELEKLLEKYSIDTLVLENIFLDKNVKTSFVLGQVRGVCLSLLAKSKANVEFLEHSPTYVKKHITGNGHCSKEKVQEFLSKIHGIDFKDMLLDASDAVAVALCGVNSKTTEEALEKQNLRL
ncbi:MAG: crossover junction endodeoxyribonuclease RuvC [Bdellovibrionaceae bacterium]|nr:crossover junction endodeoxyribonuclease RuvC [Pseudobdellovibrionaceae bacterium]